VQIKLWLLGISPMVRRRVLVPNACTLRELHGVIQVAMGWEGIHRFCCNSKERPSIAARPTPIKKPVSRTGSLQTRLDL